MELIRVDTRVNKDGCDQLANDTCQDLLGVAYEHDLRFDMIMNIPTAHDFM